MQVSLSNCDVYNWIFFSKDSPWNSLQNPYEKGSSNEYLWNYIRSTLQCSKMTHFLCIRFHTSDFAPIFRPYTKRLKRPFCSQRKALSVQTLTFRHIPGIYSNKTFSLVLLCSDHLNFPLRLVTFNFVMLNRKYIIHLDLLQTWRKMFSLWFWYGKNV